MNCCECKCGMTWDSLGDRRATAVIANTKWERNVIARARDMRMIEDVCGRLGEIERELRLTSTGASCE
jgi:hypothetical protein